MDVNKPKSARSGGEVPTRDGPCQYDVGGVLLDQPFAVRRLGHFGLVSDDIDATFAFYRDLIGFEVSEEQDIAELLPAHLRLDSINPRDTVVHMLRHGAEHHSLVLFSDRLNTAMQQMLYDRLPPDQITANQITWQVGSLSEVVNGTRYFRENGLRVLASGRDMPGSNWHVYVEDPDGFSTELYYGMELIGWQGFSKPLPMYKRGFHETPSLPQPSERWEVDDAIMSAVDLAAGYRPISPLAAEYDVDGIKLPRPFKVTKIGPVGLFVDNPALTTAFYRDHMGFQVAGDGRSRQGHGLTYLRTNADLHALVVAHVDARAALGFSETSKVGWFGMQVANYRQLRDAVAFLRERGVEVRTDVDPALHPGIEHAAFARDPDGHMIMLYWSLAQAGARAPIPPHSKIRLNADGTWPEQLTGGPMPFAGETLIGPWG